MGTPNPFLPYVKIPQEISINRNEIITAIVKIASAAVTSYFITKWIVRIIDPTYKAKTEKAHLANRILQRLGIKDVNLTDHELMIASQLIEPSSLSNCYEDVAGLDDVISNIKDSVILPLQNPHLFSKSELVRPPRGLLLHGPPGCGKTMIAKGTAREANARFINLDISSLTDKWYGESQKITAAVFSLAYKIQPTIIFIDEIDALLRSRGSDDHEATAMIKSQFMSLWDGLITDKDCQVIVMGATNRPQDVDKAIIRRMPAMFQIKLPNEVQRENILKLILRNESVDDDVNYSKIAQGTPKFSGSDLKELCRHASIYRVRECIKEIKSRDVNSAKENEAIKDANLRPINACDFKISLEQIKAAKFDVTNGFNNFSPIGLD